jgi:hypothetical protein
MRGVKIFWEFAFVVLTVRKEQQVEVLLCTIVVESSRVESIPNTVNLV